MGAFSCVACPGVAKSHSAALMTAHCPHKSHLNRLSLSLDSEINFMFTCQNFNFHVNNSVLSRACKNVHTALGLYIYLDYSATLMSALRHFLFEHAYIGIVFPSIYK